MKKAEDYLKEIVNTSQGGVHIQSISVLNIIKQVQEDAIRETVRECSESAETVWVYGENSVVDKNSILSVADKLIQQQIPNYN